MAHPRTNGEKFFASLLDERKLQNEYEVPAVGKKSIPDFTLTFTTPDVKAEVKDFDLNDEDVGIVQTLSRGLAASWSSNQPYTRIRRAIDEKASQLKEYTDAPAIIVFARSPQNLTVDLSTNNILESMLGDYVVEITLDDKGKHKVNPILKPQNAALGARRRTHISAIVVIEEHRPFQHIAERIGKEFLKKSGDRIMTEEGQVELTRLFDEERAKGTDLDLVVNRFRIMHNPFASRPLPVGFFDSKYDEEITFDSNRKTERHYFNSVQEYPLR